MERGKTYLVYEEIGPGRYHCYLLDENQREVPYGEEEPPNLAAGLQSVLKLESIQRMVMMLGEVIFEIELMPNFSPNQFFQEAARIIDKEIGIQVEPISLGDYLLSDCCRGIAPLDLIARLHKRVAEIRI